MTAEFLTELPEELTKELNSLIRFIFGEGVAPDTSIPFTLSRHSVSHGGIFKGTVSFRFGGKKAEKETEDE